MPVANSFILSYPMSFQRYTILYLLNLSGSPVRVLHASENSSANCIFSGFPSLHYCHQSAERKECQRKPGSTCAHEPVCTRKRMRAVKDATILVLYQCIYLISPRSGASSPTDYLITQNHRISSWKRSLDVIYWQHQIGPDRALSSTIWTTAKDRDPTGSLSNVFQRCTTPPGEELQQLLIYSWNHKHCFVSFTTEFLTLIILAIDNCFCGSMSNHYSLSDLMRGSASFRRQHF